MKIINILIIFIFIIACGRPHSTEQESNEIVARERLSILNQNYQEVIGNYTGSFELIGTNEMYDIKLELRIAHELDPNTNLPLTPKLIGTMFIYELVNNTQNLLATYGITNGSYDKNSQTILLDIADKFNIRGEANSNILNGILHSTIKGDVGHLKLVRNL